MTQASVSIPPETLQPQPATSPRSPAHRAWRRFRSNRLGYASLVIFLVLFGLSLIAEALSNDKPIVVRYQGQWYFPLLQVLPETTFGGDFPTPTDYHDPLIRENLAKPGNFALYPLNKYHHSSRSEERRVGKECRL